MPWGTPFGATDSEGSEITVSEGSGKAEGHTLIGDGDRGEGSEHASENGSFMNSSNHDHYGPGDGANDNGTDRGQYSGPGSK
jgi:hypothetical protein